ncbi:MAG TPA: phosphoenolpyruvate carboxykinase (ATP) [Acidimicrobiia bacterium]|nr:phosphoenolpyruvate carboxykinase (ATP) [Acidimicrobiia bacterium]
MVELPNAASVEHNPSQERLRELALASMPRLTLTQFGNLNYEAEVTARLKNSTFFVADEEIHQNRISRAEAEEWARLQDAHVGGKAMLLIEGYIGPDPAFRTGARLFIEAGQPNIAGMQAHLFFPTDESWRPHFTVIYTPTLPAPGKPDDRLILVDLENWVTRVFGSDYFGESKMGGLRMWNRSVYDQGGLALHAGLKTYPASSTRTGDEESMLIIGLSGTGKTTTTFRQQAGSLPVQDDFVALMPGGVIHTTEAGCFAKTYGLDPADEPTIYGGTTSTDAWLENVSVGPDGVVDFFDTRYTANGRSTFPLQHVRHRDPSGVPPARYLLILNRSEHVVPGVSRLRREQIAAFFMLGETKGTSAGGTAEAGKSLRVPGTNPFFFNDDSWQGNRLLEILATTPELEAFVLNTGRVGGEGDGSKKVSIAASSAMVQGIVEGTIEWEIDPDFGYEVAVSVPGVDDPDLLRPRLLYESRGRGQEYRSIVDRLKAERVAYLTGYRGLDPEILAGLQG